jgi:hypothetical protein
LAFCKRDRPLPLSPFFFHGGPRVRIPLNIAARLEGIAEPGGICISDDAFRQVRGKIEAEFANIGEQSLKNIRPPSARLPHWPVTCASAAGGSADYIAAP